ncbi:MAG: hypothetical protein EOP45_13680 [Sphingobacteriaceae bacterium]|nr:MAG: hypothetical protein EOP45_13680 [Sphingobacteriaceae bacterium]
MPIFGSIGNWSSTANAIFLPTKLNWSSIGASDENTQLMDYSLMNVDGSITIQTSGLYRITIYCSSNELNYIGTGKVSIVYRPLNGTAFTLGGVSLDSNFIHIMSLTMGDIIIVQYSFNSPVNRTFALPSTINVIQLDYVDPNKYYAYYASTAIAPLLNPQPRTLDFSGVLSSGYQVKIPLTIDSTLTGAAAFQNITSITATAVSSVASTSAANILVTSLNPVPTSLKYVIVNIGQGTVISTLLAGSNMTIVSAPSGSIVYLTVRGW